MVVVRAAEQRPGFGHEFGGRRLGRAAEMARWGAEPVREEGGGSERGGAGSGNVCQELASAFDVVLVVF